MSYITDYRDCHRLVGARLTRDEHAKFAAIAAKRGMKPTTLATHELRKLIEAARETLAPDAGEGEC